MHLDSDKFGTELGNIIKEGIQRATKPLIERIETLESQIRQKGISYRGVHQRSENYRHGDFVTFKGSMWHCVRDTTAEPAESNDWQLAVQRGRDASETK